MRIGSIKGVLKQRRLWLNANMPGYENLVNDLKKWPKLGKHDDYGDAMGLVVTVPTGIQLDKPPASRHRNLKSLVAQAERAQG